MKLLYIDDEPLKTVSSFISRIINDDIHIEYIRVNTFEKILEHITHFINNLKYDGVILDWQLNKIAYEDEGKEGAIRAKFKAAEVAQFIRRSIGDGEVNTEIPIFVWSMEDRFKMSYDQDNSSHDLFDQIYYKTQISQDNVRVRIEMLSFLDAYRSIRAVLEDPTNFSYEIFLSFLNTSPENNFGIDESVYEYLLGSEKIVTIQLVVRFIYKEIIKRAGLLISEKLLAIRLGIDVEISPDWNNLLETLSEFKYTGLFSQCNSVYWTRGIYDYWGIRCPEYPDLSNLSAEKRVDILKNMTGFKELLPLKPSENNPGLYFWNYCEKTYIPLDPDDSVMIREPDPLPWQERRYISLFVAENDLGKKDGLLPHILEKYKFES